MKIQFGIVCMLVKYLFSVQVCAMGLMSFDVINYFNKSVVLLHFTGLPVYNFRVLHAPERLVLDISYVFQVCSLKKFPVYFSNRYLIHSICIDDLLNKGSIRFIFDLNYLSRIDDVLLEKSNGSYIMLLIITSNLPAPFSDSLKITNDKGHYLNSFLRLPIFRKNKNPCIRYIEEKFSINNMSTYQWKMFSYPIVVAIDAGHGGYDPGAKGCSGLYEKDITIAIAKKFKKILDKDPMFSPVMIRDGDYFISVFERSELARRKGAKILLSIHADAVSRSSKNTVRGASVWVLSNNRANIEMTSWLKNGNHISKSFKGLTDVSIGSLDSDPYLNRTILDLQFSHFQRVGYEIALHILRELKNVSLLHKFVPEYSNFGILRSLDIVSLLIETGFMTNKSEEKLLASGHYQEKIACALYEGLRSYFLRYVFFSEKKYDYKVSCKINDKYLYKNFKCKCM